MKKLNLLLAAAALLFSAQFAQADIKEPVWSCNLTFDVKGGGLKLLVGYFRLKGYGEITCADVQGNVERIPVAVTLGAKPVSLSVGVGSLRLVGIATGIGIATQPQDLLGSYLVGSIRGAIGVGAGADMALHASDNSLTINAAVQAVAGLGANLGFDVMTIEALR